MLKIQTISSGSAGNVTYIGNESVSILVDVGLSLPQTQKLLAKANIDPSKINAILITHEHSDHIKGIADFVNLYNTKIYCHKKTTKILKDFIKVSPDNFVEFENELKIADIDVSYFPVPHDSRFCLGYTFSCGDACVGIATDIGQMTETILSHLSNCQVVVLESNHDVNTLVANQKYPVWLKKRILGSRGHLSNLDCGHTIEKLCENKVSQIILAHLSEKNNNPSLAYQTVKEYLKSRGITEGIDIFIDVALQSQIGNLYCVD